MNARHIAFLELLNSNVQDVVPRWQRRYCWGESDIKRLLEDLMSVGQTGVNSHAVHYGGTVLTFPESSAAGVVPVHRRVDGPQRLMTVSILLACIAEALGPEGPCGDWTAKIIKATRLTHAQMTPGKLLKLRLQGDDDKEYASGLNGRVAGAGAVAQAWKVIQRLVGQYDISQLLAGLQRFRVVTIGLGE